MVLKFCLLNSQILLAVWRHTMVKWNIVRLILTLKVKGHNYEFIAFPWALETNERWIPRRPRWQISYLSEDLMFLPFCKKIQIGCEQISWVWHTSEHGHKHRNRNLHAERTDSSISSHANLIPVTEGNQNELRNFPWCNPPQTTTAESTTLVSLSCTISTAEHRHFTKCWQIGRDVFMHLLSAHSSARQADLTMLV